MISFAWRDDLSVGNTFIDNDHRHLIGLLNNLFVAIDQGTGPDMLGPVLDDLIQYTQEHFKREEDVMRAIRYDGFFEHKEEHERLTKEVLETQRRFIAGETDLSAEVMMFLHDWLFEHITKVDIKLAKAIKDDKSRAEYQAQDMQGRRQVGPASK